MAVFGKESEKKSGSGCGNKANMRIVAAYPKPPIKKEEKKK